MTMNFFKKQYEGNYYHQELEEICVCVCGIKNYKKIVMAQMLMKQQTIKPNQIDFRNLNIYIM